MQSAAIESLRPVLQRHVVIPLGQGDFVPPQPSPHITMAPYSSGVIVPPSFSAIPWSHSGKASCKASIRFHCGPGVLHPGCGAYWEVATRWYGCI